MSDCTEVKIRARAVSRDHVAAFIIAARELAGSQEKGFVTLDCDTNSTFLGMLTVRIKGRFEDYFSQLKQLKRENEADDGLKVRVRNITSNGERLEF